MTRMPLAEPESSAASGARPASILVVEDRPEVAEMLRRTLASQNYDVSVATDGEAGVRLAMQHQPDLLLLDVMLPKQSGFDVARELRSRGFRSPVLMLTARDTVADKVAGLDAGADDYLAKPFDADELLARVKALLRRSALSADAVTVRVGPVSLDRLTREVRRDGEVVPLTQREYALLEFLMRHAGQPVTRETICEQVWKAEFDPSTNIVDVYITYLRRKLDSDDEPSLLQTVRGVGYMMREG